MKKILGGIFIGFCCRIVFEQVKNSMGIGLPGLKNVQSKENCLPCHVNDVCKICPPIKIKVKDRWLQSAYKPKGMYEVTRWSMFDDSNIYDIINGEPKSPIKGIYIEEIENTTKVAMKYLNSNQMLGKTWSLKNVRNGFLQTDSSMGTEYLLDLLVEPIRKVENQMRGLIKEEETFRIHLQHPLLPINTINNEWISIIHNMKRKVKIIVPISQDSTPLNTLIEHVQMILENIVEVEFFIVYFHESNKNANEIVFNAKKKISEQQNIKILEETGAFTYIDGIAKAASDMQPTDLILALQDDMDFKTSLLNHCRSVCLEGKRVYFPIPFAEYNSEVVEKGMPPGKPKNLDKKEHNKFTGTWAHKLHNNFCAHQSDISRLLRKSRTDNANTENDWIYNSFLKLNYDVVMAVEPSLYKLNHRNCYGLKPKKHKHAQCLKSQALFLGSKPTLGFIHIKEVLQLK